MVKSGPVYTITVPQLLGPALHSIGDRSAIEYRCTRTVDNSRLTLRRR